jgi:hypothetical protein
MYIDLPADVTSKINVRQAELYIKNKPPDLISEGCQPFQFNDVPDDHQ